MLCVSQLLPLPRWAQHPLQRLNILRYNYTHAGSFGPISRIDRGTDFDNNQTEPGRVGPSSPAAGDTTCLISSGGAQRGAARFRLVQECGVYRCRGRLCPDRSAATGSGDEGSSAENKQRQVETCREPGDVTFCTTRHATDYTADTLSSSPSRVRGHTHTHTHSCSRTHSLHQSLNRHMCCSEQSGLSVRIIWVGR